MREEKGREGGSAGQEVREGKGVISAPDICDTDREGVITGLKPPLLSGGGPPVGQVEGVMGGEAGEGREVVRQVEGREGRWRQEGKEGELRSFVVQFP